VARQSFDKGSPGVTTSFFQEGRPEVEEEAMHPGDRVARERGLWHAVVAGDERAWQTWYDESFAGLYAYVSWRCAGLRNLTEDVVQETWLTAVRRIRTFDPERASFVAWLQGIAVNVLRNQLRREACRRRYQPSANGRVARPADAELEQCEHAEQVVRALAQLPERYEAVLRAKYFEQQSVQTIAVASGETPKAIESLLTRARQAFREAYQRLEPHHE
jgi:RNA polymerase sigma-70 factor (ECF subfamily)